MKEPEAFKEIVPFMLREEEFFCWLVAVIFIYVFVIKLQVYILYLNERQ